MNSNNNNISSVNASETLTEGFWANLKDQPVVAGEMESFRNILGEGSEFTPANLKSQTPSLYLLTLYRFLVFVNKFNNKPAVLQDLIGFYPFSEATASQKEQFFNDLLNKARELGKSDPTALQNFVNALKNYAQTENLLNDIDKILEGVENLVDEEEEAKQKVEDDFSNQEEQRIREEQERLDRELEIYNEKLKAQKETAKKQKDDNTLNPQKLAALNNLAEIRSGVTARMLYKSGAINKQQFEYWKNNRVKADWQKAMDAKQDIVEQWAADKLTGIVKAGDRLLLNGVAKLSRKENKDNKGLFEVTKEFISAKINGVIDGIKEIPGAIKTGLQSIRVVNQIGEVINTTKTNISSVVTGVKANPLVKGVTTFGQYSWQTLKTGSELIKHGRNGLVTGASVAVPAAMFAATLGPALVVPVGIAALAGGTFVGSTNSFFKAARNFNLLNPDKLDPFFKFKVQYASVNNPNWINNSIVEFHPSARPIVNDIRTNTALFNRMRSIKYLSHGMSSIPLAGIATAIGLGLGFGPGAFLLGGGALAAGTLYRVGFDSVVENLARGNRTMVHMFNFPGLAAYDTARGSVWLSDQGSFIQKHGWENYLKLQGETINIPFLNQGISNGFINTVQGLSYTTGSFQLSGWAVKLANATAAIPIQVKLMPIIFTLAYIGIASMLGLPITPGILIGVASTGLVVGLALSGVTMGTSLIAGTVFAGVTYGLYKLGEWFDELVGNNIDKLSLIPQLMHLWGLIRAFQDMLETSLRRLSDYAKLIPAALSFIVIIATLEEEAARNAYVPDKIQPAQAQAEAVSPNNQMNVAGASDVYTMPALIYDCNNIDGNIIATNNLTIEEIVPTQNSNNTELQNLKARTSEGRLEIYRNLNTIYFDNVSNNRILPGEVIGNCD